MSVILSSNVPHYHHAARALADAGRLRRYITGVVPRGLRIERLLPPFWSAKLSGRGRPPIDDRLVVSLMLPELAQRATAVTRVLTPERSVRLQNALFDTLASRQIDACRAFHFVSSVGLRSARKAKQLGALVVCDERSEHPDVQLRVLEPEYERLGLPYRPHVRIWDDVVRAEYELSDHLVVGSSYSKETYLEAGWEEARVHVLPYGFDSTLFAPAAERNYDGPLTFIFVGQLTPRKGVHYLVEAFKRLRRNDARLQLVGRIDPLLRRHLDDWRTVPGIEVVGEVPKVDLPRFYDAAHVFVLPSLADAQPLTCLEAMASGLPAVVTTAMGSREIVRDGLDGLVVPPADADALAHALDRLEADRRLVSGMAAASLRRVRDFDWTAYEAGFRALYDTLLA